MAKTIFLAGASGAVGRRLAPLLITQGWRVVGTTRSKEKVPTLLNLGIEAAVVDVFDPEALTAAVVEAKPQVVIHQLTDLPSGLDPALMAEATMRNARIRDEGTRNLVSAAIQAGAERFIAQSVSFAYAEGELPHKESDPLAVNAEGRAGISARGVASLEQQVIPQAFCGIVLRYGKLFGPGTGFASTFGSGSLHVDAAAYAAALAVSHGESGIYNVAEDDATVDCTKVKRELRWSADWRNSG
jgi:nucleoside-diphosphate-sugar epimerase